jgi:hypothetical protein
MQMYSSITGHALATFFLLIKIHVLQHLGFKMTPSLSHLNHFEISVMSDQIAWTCPRADILSFSVVN